MGFNSVFKGLNKYTGKEGVVWLRTGTSGMLLWKW